MEDRKDILLRLLRILESAEVDSTDISILLDGKEIPLFPEVATLKLVAAEDEVG